MINTTIAGPIIRIVFMCPPPCTVTPQDHDRIFADAEGKAAVRLMNERVDAAEDDC